MKIKKAFTLSEVLIALMIIGIIASVTIPPIISATKRHETISALKKANSSLQQAITHAQAKYGSIKDWALPESEQYERAEAFARYIIPNMNVMKICGKESGCFADTTYKYLDGSIWTSINARNDLYKFVLSDGMSVAIKMYDESSVNSQGFFVDINGAKPPNVRGIDEFVFVVNFQNNSVLPYGIAKSNEEINSDCSKTGKGNYCSSYIFRYNNADYLN